MKAFLPCRIPILKTSLYQTGKYSYCICWFQNLGKLSLTELLTVFIQFPNQSGSIPYGDQGKTTTQQMKSKNNDTMKKHMVLITKNAE